LDIVWHNTSNKSSRLRHISAIDTVIIHYTGSMSLHGTLAWFEDPTSRVSAHFVIGQKGEIHNFEQIRTKLWHAGKSEWNGIKNLNNTSIGIELVGTYNSGFMEAQYVSLLTVLNLIYRECDTKYVLGHEQVSPGRKIDPGPNFDWVMIRAHAERSGVPYLERTGIYTLQPPTAGAIPLTASPTVIPDGHEEEGIWTSIKYLARLLARLS
jgi:N-acetyl-anhydromuramyl-L-alanine amidase AmpD